MISVLEVLAVILVVGLITAMAIPGLFLLGITLLDIWDHVRSPRR